MSAGNENPFRDAFNWINVIEEAFMETEASTPPSNENQEYGELMRRTVTRKVLEKVRMLAGSNNLGRSNHGEKERHQENW